MKLIEFIAKRTGLGKRQAKRFLANGEVYLNHEVCGEANVELGKFDHLSVSGKVLCALSPRYVFLNKPSGVLSATKDPLHPTVIDLIKEPWASELHLAGRLDRSSTGLVILTNDSRFSRYLSHPDSIVPKTYRVATDQFIREEVIGAFQKGMFFAKENTDLKPARVELLGERECRLTIFEGKHHQIKRMFLQFGIRVTQLHREKIGHYSLPDDLVPGAYRNFQPEVLEESIVL